MPVFAMVHVETFFKRKYKYETTILKSSPVYDQINLDGSTSVFIWFDHVTNQVVHIRWTFKLVFVSKIWVTLKAQCVCNTLIHKLKMSLTLWCKKNTWFYWNCFSLNKHIFIRRYLLFLYLIGRIIMVDDIFYHSEVTRNTSNNFFNVIIRVLFLSFAM